MCFNCGCFNPDDNMGDPHNITNHTLRELALTWQKTPEQTKNDLYALLEKNDPQLESDEAVKNMFTQAAKAWGQSVAEAKKNTQMLLKNELKR